ncbi:MAG: globin-coupled sensor protein [Hyphomicrobium sp.]|jgi:methyl-accepting chemotaxis protein
MQSTILKHSIAPELKDRVAFVEIDSETIAALQSYKDALKNVLPGILAEFYAHVAKWPALASMFKNPSRMDHARAAQEKHWLHLFSAAFDEEYYQSVRRIGLIHSHVGLEPSWYIGAYAFTLSRLYRHAAHHYRSRFAPQAAQAKAASLLRALNQCAMIDMDLAISIYLEENKRTYDSKLAALAQTFEGSIGAVVDGITSASTELEASAESLASMASQASASSASVAAAAEEASTNVATVSSATEEMTASIAQVAELANTSYASAQKAADETERSVTIMTELKQAITAVSQVATLISDIAEQTNLLALNATIEAARAGDAGKGFAVVASEVKNLAGETARATEEIRRQVTEILGRSEEASQALLSVEQVIHQSREVSHGTAQAAEQQKLAIGEIARNIDQASSSTGEISRNIADINEAAQENGHSAEQVLGAVKDLSQQGVNLHTAVNEFLSNIKTGTL